MSEQPLTDTATDPTTVLQETAAALWRSFTENERLMVRIGMFPAEKMEAAEMILRPILGRDTTRRLAVALMDLAASEPRPAPTSKRRRR